MLKNKIYKYLAQEVLKNFFIILLTFTVVAWTVRAVNFLDLMVEDGYASNIYFKYTFLNISTIASKFIPLSFLLSLVISILKFERQKELLILWTSGLDKIKVANIFLLISIFLALLQILLSLIINPYLLNKSRFLLKETQLSKISSVIKTNDFTDTFEGVTFYVKGKNSQNVMENIFIKDVNGTLSSFTNNSAKSNDSIIIAESGYAIDKKLILFNGTIQTMNQEKQIKNFNFKKTELSVANFLTRTIVIPKLQETSSLRLMKCLMKKNKKQYLENCPFKNSNEEVVNTLSRRLGLPLYLPLISIISSFLLIYKKEKKNIFLKKYFIFLIGFTILVLAEMFLKYTGFSLINFILYFSFPIVLFIILYFFLIKNIFYERRL